MSILLHHFKELTECISEVERIESKVNNTMKKTEDLVKKEEEEEEQKEKAETKETPTTTLDAFLMTK